MRTVPASAEQIPSLLAQMSPARRSAFEARSGGRALQAIADDIAQSDMTFCGLDDAGAVVTMGGVMPTGQPGIGYVWQFVTPALLDHKRDYLLQGRLMTERFLARYQHLVAWIEPENLAAQRHARRLGARRGPILPLNGATAHLYERTRDE